MTYNTCACTEISPNFGLQTEDSTLNKFEQNEDQE